MGSGAVAGVTAAVDMAAEADLEKILQSMPDATRDKVLRALTEKCGEVKDSPQAGFSDQPQISGSSCGTILFDVRGRMFKVLPELINSKPSTLLAQLLDDVAADVAQPIFVDANPSRFDLILDWYRYGEMFLPKGMPLPALLRDCDFFLLPDVVVVNGIPRSTLRGQSSAISSHADHVREQFVDGILDQWPSFDAFFQERLAELSHAFQTRPTSTGCNVWDVGDISQSYIDTRIQLRQVCQERTRQLQRLQYEWTFPNDVCSMDRAKVFAMKLHDRGYTCKFDQEGGLLVSLLLDTNCVHPQPVVMSSLEVVTICPRTRRPVCPAGSVTRPQNSFVNRPDCSICGNACSR